MPVVERPTTREHLSHRFFTKVEFTPWCWEWSAYRNPTGYGIWNVEGAPSILAHRTSVWLFHGHLDPDLDVDHLCKNRGCVNPEHLVQIDPIVHRYQDRWQTSCKRGHDLTAPNARRRTGKRRCRRCANEDNRRYRERIHHADRG